MTALIGFLRDLVGELNARANGWADSAGLASSSGGLGEAFALRASILRELAGAIEAAMKRTLLT